MAAIVINVAGSYDDKAIRQAQTSLGKLGTETGKTQRSMSASFKTMAIAAAAVGFAVMKIGRGFVDVAKEAQKARAANAATEAILKSTGATAWTTSKAIGDLADSLSRKTGVDDEAIQASQNLLLTFKNVKNAGEGQAAMFDRASAAALDLSKAGFGSLDSAAKMLGKALNDPIRGVSALSRAGVTFTQQQKDQIKALQESGNLLGAQALIMQEVESQVGGVAQAVASPFERLQTMLGNFKEQLGAAVLPAFEQIINGLQPVLDQIAGPLGQLMGSIATSLADVFASIAPMLGPLAASLSAVVQLVGQGLVQALGSLVPTMIPFVQLLGDLATGIGPALVPLLGTIAQVMQGWMPAILPLLQPLTALLVDVFTKAAPILNMVMGILPGIVQAMAPLVSVVGTLLPPLQNLADVALTAVMGVVEPLLPVIQQLAAFLGNGLGQVVQSLVPLITDLSGTVGTLLQFLGPFLTQVVQALLPLVQQLAGIVGDVLLKALAAVAPIVAQLGAFLGELAQAVLVPLLPLVQQLAGLVGEVLQAALQPLMPLLNLVATLLGVVMAVIQPLLPVITSLAGVLVQLVGVALQPAISAVSFLAKILGDVLTRAVGLIMAAIGKWLTLMAPVASWVLTNLIKPIASGFFTLAQSVIDSAANMFSWVPGIGDKLNEAKSSLEGFRSTVDSAITSAADTVATQGASIGQGLVDSGLALVKDPNAPTNAGATFGSNIATGVQGAMGSVGSAGAALGSAAAGGFTDAWAAKIQASNLPDYIKSATLAGRTPTAPQTFTAPPAADTTTRTRSKASKDTKDKTRRTLADLQKDLGKQAAQEARRRQLVNAGLPKALADSIINEDGWRQVSRQVLDGGKAAVRDLVKQWRKTGAGRDELAQLTKDEHKAALDRARAVLDGFKEQAKAFRDYVKQTVASLADFGSVTQLQADDRTAPTGSGILKQMRERLAQVRKFGAYLRDLKKLGLNNSSLQQIIAAGPEAGAQIAAALLAEGRSAIREVNKLEQQFTAASANVGRIGAESQFGITAQQAKGYAGTTLNVQTLQVNFGDGVTAGDKATIRRQVQQAVNEAINALARESSRTGGK